MKKKRIIVICVFAFVAVVVFYASVAYIVPISKFRKTAKRFDTIVRNNYDEGFTDCSWSSEMEIEKYREFREELLENRWAVLNESKDEECLFHKGLYAVPLGISHNHYFEEITVTIHGEKALLEYKAELTISAIPFVKMH
ncbi:MAG: hypothetical protein J5532_05355 [Lachnospiraceae bacterium]|nr:hypothetical protein [Lachnospiraceae bacterium]